MQVSNWRQKHTDRARQAFVKAYGEVEAERRAAQISAVESKEWRGQTVYKIVCQADFGKGPHDQFVPEGLLWALIDIHVWRCPFHKN